MTAADFAEIALRELRYDPNDQQIMVLAALSRFVTEPAGAIDRVFLLNGYAGTGKTSLTSAVVRALGLVGRQVVLLAPTGRAAKVFGAFAGRQAYTIHRRIYRGAAIGSDAMIVADNPLTDAVFIVDEASMIGEGTSGGHLLDDLIHYVYSSAGCRLILLGDTAQLPPVGLERSTAMDPDNLRGYGLRVSRAVMTMTVRQSASSGVLWNATWLRRAMKMPQLPPPRLKAAPFADVRCVDSEELADSIADDYAADGMENTIVITRSNNRATRFNLAIRTLINMSEEELVSGERLMIAKNNYFCCRGLTGIDFVANGDMAVVSAIHGVETRYGIRFADIDLSLPDRDITLRTKIILDSLVTDHPALDPLSLARLRDGVLAEASGGAGLSATECAKVLRADPWFNALQVKYAYAVTCHKAQGGQWRNVYVDLGYVSEDTPGLDFYRWLYTAITRTTGRLNLISPVIPVD